MKLIHKSLSICLIMAICLAGLPAARADARTSAGEIGTEEWTAPQPPGVTHADWQQIRSFLDSALPAQQAYLKSSNTGAFDSFGASIAISGDTIVVGAYLEDSNATGVNGDQNNDLAHDAGAAYVFVRNGTTWSQQAYLKGSNTHNGDHFGFPVAISGDTIVVGASYEDSNAMGVNGDQNDNSADKAGAAYVFIRNGTTWSQQAYLKASNTEANDSFGASIAISGDTIVVGAEGDDSNARGVNGDQGNNSAPASGAAYVFIRNGTTWSQQAYLKASNTDPDDQFGAGVAISGNTLVVGAYREASNATGANGDQSDNSAPVAGAAYVFVRNGTTWSQQAYLKASNTEEGDSFGASIDISGDTIVIGAQREDSNATGVNGDQGNNSAGNAGAAYVFVRNGTTWSQQAYLKASNTEAEDFFSRSPVAISGDTIVIGASYEDSSATGVNGDQSDNSAPVAGAAYVFTRSGSTWSQQAYLKASNTEAEDLFSESSVAVSGDTIAIGAVLEDSSATGVNGDQGNNAAPASGAAYVFFTPLVTVIIGGIERGAYALNPSESTRQNYIGVNDGPVKIIDNSDTSLIAAQRLIYKFNGINTSFMEMMGLPDNQLDNAYWLPWYNNLGLNSQLRFANVSGTTTSVSVSIGGVPMEGSPFILQPGESTRMSFVGIDDGPVKIESDVNLVAAERVIYKVNGLPTSFSEMMAFPNSQLETTYWLPWYNNLGLDSQLRFANVSNATATVHVFIGGEEVDGSPFTLQAGDSTRQSFPGIDDGPVMIESDAPIVAAERVVYKVNGSFTSYAEMMALPDGQLDTTFWFPWYNNLGLDSQLRFANVSNAIATVHIFIGGEEVHASPFTLQPGESVRQSFPGIDDGPVRIESDVPIVASQRVVYKVNGAFTSFTEMMGLPESQLDTTYWFPWYNNLGLNTQLRFGRP